MYPAPHSQKKPIFRSTMKLVTHVHSYIHLSVLHYCIDSNSNSFEVTFRIDITLVSVRCSRWLTSSMPVAGFWPLAAFFCDCQLSAFPYQLLSSLFAFVLKCHVLLIRQSQYFYIVNSNVRWPLTFEELQWNGYRDGGLKTTTEINCKISGHFHKTENKYHVFIYITSSHESILLKHYLCLPFLIFSQETYVFELDDCFDSST